MDKENKMKHEVYFACIDVGTTRFKAALVSQRGEIITRSEYYYHGENDFYHEYKMSEFKEALGYTFKRLSDGIDMHKIKAVGITGHGPTLIPVGKDGRALFAAVGYLDDRVKKYIKRLVERKTDRITSTMYIPIALFFKDELSEIYKNTHKFLQSFDYIAFLMTGEFAASSSSKGIKPWDKKSLDKAGLEEEKFPPIHYMGKRIGNVTESALKIYGIPENVPVFAVGVDFAAALVGTNTLLKGKSCERSGSSGGINLCWNSPVNDNRLLSYKHFIHGLWNIAGITSTSGKALDWINKVVGTAEFNYRKKTGSNDEIVFFPYLKGERTPLWNPYAKGMFFGLTSQHTKDDLIFSVYLGIVLSLRDCIEIIEKNKCSFDFPIATTGWGAKKEWFIQLKSDVTGKSFTKIQVEDAEILGTAIVCTVAAGYYRDIITAADSIVREKKIFTPDKKKFHHYSRTFMLYKDLQQKLIEYF